MNRIDLPVANALEADRLWPVVKAAHLFADRDAYRAARDAAPWRVRADARERAVVLERWRPHLDVMAIRALWAPKRDITAVIEGLRPVARAQGLARILSPLLAEDAEGPYARAGLARCAELVALRMDPRDALSLSPEEVEGVRLRPARPLDAEELDLVDSQSFEPFWAYGVARLRDSVARERVVVAESDGAIIGYTLSTVERGSGTLGRLAVVSHERGRGVGAALLTEALRHMAGDGVGSISLCTQVENVASRSLYTRVGLRELPGRLVLLMGDA